MKWTTFIGRSGYDIVYNIIYLIDTPPQWLNVFSSYNTTTAIQHLVHSIHCTDVVLV